jgi:D-alanine-D-alanine ligase-like ATP-grasp enzyme
MTSRPTAAFDDPVLRRHAYRIEHVGLNAFLVALAAWQRGLRVTFHYEVTTKCERFAKAAVQGHRGELFSVSDGRKTHYFRRTLGDLTSHKASQLCDDKQATKQRLREHGIDVPDGIVVRREDIAAIDAFLARYAGRRFLLKPRNGTLGQGVYRRLMADDVYRMLPNLEGDYLLEESIDGQEYRLHVVDKRCIASLERVPANVVGDGQHTLAELIERKQQQRLQHPLYRKAPLPPHEQIQAFLADQGRSMKDVSALGECVWLSDIPSVSAGGEMREVAARLPPHVAELTVRVQVAVGVPNTGIDLIIQRPGEPDERVVVLEANQNPHIYADALPFPGIRVGGDNRIAEAMIDHYFPATTDHPRYPQASFDFMKVCETLQNGMIGEVTLPVLGPGWVHKRFQVAAASRDDKTLPTIRNAMITYGIHAQLLNSAKGDLIVDVVAPEELYTAFLAALGGMK